MSADIVNEKNQPLRTAEQPNAKPTGQYIRESPVSMFGGMFAGIPISSVSVIDQHIIRELAEIKAFLRELLAK